MKEIQELVQTHTRKYPWCPLALLIGGAVLFLLGLILSATIIKTLWFLVAIVALAAGGIAFYFAPPKKSAAPKPPAEKKPPEEE